VTSFSATVGDPKEVSVLRVMIRRTNDLSYFTEDRAAELDGLRSGGPGWWWRGEGDPAELKDVARVLTTTPRSSIYGYDVVVAAPRPISILIAVDPSSADGVVAAHRVSVAATMNYLEQHALVVRDRRGGEDRDVAGRWREVVSYTHGLNRHGEPHLHDHVLVGARVADASAVLDSRALFAHTVAADAVYRGSLRYELAERTPWVAWRSFEGVDHVQGLDEGYRSLWGGHHSDRGEKLHWGREETMEHWSRDLERFQPEVVLTSPRRDVNVLDEHSFAGAFEGRREVARRHVVAAWANAAPFGVHPKELETSVNQLYPSLSGSRGVRESMVGVHDARMISDVRRHGPRPLTAPDLPRWRQRDLESERSRSARSR